MGAPRKNPVRVIRSGLTGTVYALTSYKQDDAGNITVNNGGKHDVTADVQALIDQALAAQAADDGTAPVPAPGQSCDNDGENPCQEVGTVEFYGDWYCARHAPEAATPEAPR